MEEIIQENNKGNQEQFQLQSLINQIETVIKGKRQQIEFVITCLLAKGHILMEDNPGAGKTVLARTLALSISDSKHNENVFKRIQFTPDLLPMDLIGLHIFDDSKKDFEFKKGPLFSNILLADEINRASPKVQSALLECMAEGQITVGDQTMKLEDLFFVIATQNPVEMDGTYPLPAAQLDRFFMKIQFGYVDQKTEIDILKSYLDIHDNLENLQQILTKEQLLHLQKEVEKVFIHEEIIQSISNILNETRIHPDIVLGASTRSGISFLKCLKAYAFLQNRNYVIEDDLFHLTYPVLNHRMIYKNKDSQKNTLKSILNKEMERLKRINIT